MQYAAQYKDIFGKPGEGLHAVRVCDIAVVDVLFTILASMLLSKPFNIQVLHMFIILILLGIVMHAIFQVDTTINKLIFAKKINNI
jgi:hypothetical protein